MAEFRSGASRVLITTDVWGRGLDVQQARARGLLLQSGPAPRVCGAPPSARSPARNASHPKPNPNPTPDQVSLVICYDLPNNRELYIHRIGRSGRFGRKVRGLAERAQPPSRLGQRRLTPSPQPSDSALPRRAGRGDQFRQVGGHPRAARHRAVLLDADRRDADERRRPHLSARSFRQPPIRARRAQVRQSRAPMPPPPRWTRSPPAAT